MGNRRKSHRLQLLAVAVSAMLLSGCSLIGDGGTVIGFLGEDAANADRMRGLVSDVLELDEVVSAEGTFDATSAQPGPTLSVEAAPDATPEQLAAVVGRASVDYDGRWSAFLGTVRVTSAAGSVLTVTDFTRDIADVAAEITYWRAVEAVADSPLELALQPQQGAAEWSRSRLSAAPSDVAATRTVIDHYESLLALEPPPSGAGQLWLPGFSVAGGLPPHEYVRAFDGIAAGLPIKDYSAAAAEGVEFSWVNRPDLASAPGATYSVFADGVEYAADGSGSAGWRLVTEAARVLVDARLDRTTFSFQQGEEARALHFGDCGDAPAPGELPDVASAELLPALEAAGVALPSDAAPGFCQLWNAS